MLLSSGLITAPCGVPCSGVHSWASFQHALLQERLDQRQHSAIRHLPGHQGQQPVLRDRVEVALQVGIDHMDVARLEQLVHPPQRVFAAPPGRKP